MPHNVFRLHIYTQLKKFFLSTKGEKLRKCNPNLGCKKMHIFCPQYGETKGWES